MTEDQRQLLPRPLPGGREPLPHDRMEPAGPLGPDCRDGKCQACAGQALDEVADEIVRCRCPHHRGRG